MGEVAGAARCAALVGPYTSGKTSLLESVLAATGAIQKKGTAKDGTLFGDGSPEAKTRTMTTEITVAETEYLGERWNFLDCPGSIELANDAKAACMVADVAVVVCEPDPARVVTLSPLLHFLDEHLIPHLLFVNKIDGADVRVRDLMEALQAVSARPLILRQIPIRDGERVSGYVDLVSERAYRFREGEPSDLTQIPNDLTDREQASRQELLEALADFDDSLLEQLLEDAVPAKEEIYEHLKRDVAQDLVVPVLMGTAERDGGVRRLLKALRHDAPTVDVTLARRGLERDDGGPVVQVFRTVHQPHAGKLSLARVLAGEIKENSTVGGERIGGLVHVNGQQTRKATAAAAGDVFAFGRVDSFQASHLLTSSGLETAPDWPGPEPATYAVALHVENRNDEVKLTTALARLIEEDPSLGFVQDGELHQILLQGQGEQHVQIALDRLQNKFNVKVTAGRPITPYRETIRKGTTHHARFKRQTGGHGQFGDVVVEVQPLPRGEGFAFAEKVVGGAVPKQYIPAVETGVREFLSRGPLGFPVVDLAVTLLDGKHHPVDSSEQAFKTAGRLAMSEALPQCDPVLLEPICRVTFHLPSEATAALQRLASGRRGQILGFDAREGWPGWDRVEVNMPQSEMHDMIVELRSLTMGVGTYEWTFDHLQELSGRLADEVIQSRREAAQ